MLGWHDQAMPRQAAQQVWERSTTGAVSGDLGRQPQRDYL